MAVYELMILYCGVRSVEEHALEVFNMWNELTVNKFSLKKVTATLVVKVSEAILQEKSSLNEFLRVLVTNTAMLSFLA